MSDAATTTTALQEEHKAKQNKRVASYWLLEPPAAEVNDDEDRKKADKKARIERLRKNEWQVNKERFGWKGEEYYAELRRIADFELKVQDAQKSPHEQ